MALAYGMVPAGDEKAVSDATVRNMKEKYDNFMHTGIFGLGHIGQALSRYGNSQAAWDMFTKTGENSFAYMWTDADATTLWETLPVNAASKELCLRGSSLSHPMQGVYDTWFYEDIAGIRPDTSGPGFKVTRFEPMMTAYLPWAKATLETPVRRSRKRLETGRRQNGLEDRNSGERLRTGSPAGRQNRYGQRPAAGQNRYPAAGQGAENPLYRFPSGHYAIVIE